MIGFFLKKIKIQQNRKHAFLALSLLSFIFLACAGFKKWENQTNQENSQKLMLQVYRSLYSYKAENGAFPNTGGLPTPVKQLAEIVPYLQKKNVLENKFLLNNDVYIVSTDNKFTISLKNRLKAGSFQVQALNSNKQFIYN